MKKLPVSWKQLVASFLVITMFATSVSLEAFATENTNPKTKKEKTEGEYQINKADIIQSELSANSTTYDMGDGKKVTEFYSQDVRFKDENGKLTDYDPALMKVREKKSKHGESLDKYAYENKAGDKKQYFPEKLTEETPLLMEYGDYQIKLAPAETADEAPAEPIEVEKETITDIYEKEKTVPLKAVYATGDEDITYQYTSIDIGIKEEIVLKEVPDTNVFTTIIEIPGLTIRKNVAGEGFTIYDGDEIVAGIQAPNMNDATGEAYSEEASYKLELLDEEAGKYQLTLTVDKKYLKDRKRQYPVTIDPTITWSGNSKASDVYVLSGSSYKGTNFYDSGVTGFYLGKIKQGISRTYMSFASTADIVGRYVESAKLVLTECTSSVSGQTIRAYRVTESWKKKELTWNNKPAYNSTVLSSIKTTGTNKKKLTLDLTTLFRGYAKKSYSNYGILLRNASESGSPGRFYGSRHSTTSYRPKLTIVHYDPPTVPATVGVASQYVKRGNAVTAKWTGITSQSLSYVQYRLAKYDTGTQKETGVVTAYSSSTKIGTASSGSASISGSTGWANGVYKLAVRGVDASGIAGTEKATYVYVDDLKPTGSIKIVKPGNSTQEVELLQDTVQIIATVDGTITPVSKCSMALYDSEGNKVKDIFTNSTGPSIENYYTPDQPNGSYTLKMEISDKAGNTETVTKPIEIVNRLASPVLQSVKANQSRVQIPWEFVNPSGPVCGIAYKVAGSEEWTKTEAEDSSKTSGILEVVIPEAEGIYEVTVCGIDEAGNFGDEAVVECTIDTTVPEAVISRFDRGLLAGKVTDTYLKEWKVYLKKEGETITEEDVPVLSGTTPLADEDMGVIDISGLETATPYEITLIASDEAGNQKIDKKSIVRNADDTLAESNTDGFYVKRFVHEGNTRDHMIFPQSQTQMQLEGYVNNNSNTDGEVFWYCDNQKVSDEKVWKMDLSKEEGITHSVLAVIRDAEGTYHYSRNRIVNKELLPVTTGTSLELPEGMVSFRLNTGDTAVEVQASVDGREAVTLSSGQTYHVTELTGHENACAGTITITADETKSTEGWLLEADCIIPETFEFSELADYYPHEISVSDKLNYKTYLKWEGVKGEWPEGVSYEIYRGLEKDFVPSEKTLVASDIQANYWVEMNINYSKKFYYRIRAVKKDEKGNVVKADKCSYEVGSTVVAADEYVKRLGVKEYWEYAEFETPSGNGYVEKSRGNLVYIQADASLPNEQLPVTLERTYNSQSTAKTAFGVGWTHSFDMELLSNCKDNDLNYQNIVFKDGNGTLYFFDWSDELKEYISSMGKYVNLVKEDKTETVKLPEKTIGVSDAKKDVTVTSAFTMTTKDNEEYRFNSGGQLVYMSEANGNFLLFEYEPNKGLLEKVTTNRNISMEFTYHTDADYKGSGERPDLLTVKEIRLPDGSKMAYEYKDSRLSGVTKTGNDGTSDIRWSMSYNKQGILAEVTDALKNPYTITYNGQKTETVTYPNGDAIKLVYDTEKDQTKTYKVVTENGSTAEILLETNTFEAASGNSLNMTDGYGNSVDYEYQDKLLKNTFYSTTYQTIENGKITEHQMNREQSSMTASNSYDSRENLTAETDEDGITTTYEYKNDKEHLKDLPTRRTEKDKEGTIISDETYEYDDYGNVTKTYDAIGDITTITEYHPEDSTKDGALKGEVSKETEYTGDSQHNKVTTTYKYSYDEKGNKTETMTETSGDYTVSTTTVYDVMGREISSTDTLGTTTATDYDSFGRIIKITVTQKDEKETETDVVTREYDDNGTLIKEVDEDGTIYTYVYDNMNRVVSEGIAKGDSSVKTWTTSYHYGDVTINNGKGKEKVEHVLITEEKNPDGDILAVTYTDTLGNVVREKANGLYTDYVYDREDKLTFQCTLGTDVNNTSLVITAYLYDAYGNNTHQILNPVYDAKSDAFLVTEDSLTQSMTYDSTGNVVSATDGEGNTTTYAYDENGRVTKVTQPKNTTGDANETTVTYDVMNEDGTTSDIITDALGRTSITTYNSLMQTVAVTDKGDGKDGVTAIQSGYTYNKKGLLERETTSRGTQTTYEYDAKDRVTVVHYLDKDGNEEQHTCYTYDSSDNIKTMLDYQMSSGTATLYRYTGFTYDRFKRLTELVEMNTDTVPTEEEQKPYKTFYEYDIDGNLTEVTYPSGNDWKVKGLVYIYNEDQWLTEIQAILGDGTDGTLRTYTYDTYGNVSEIRDYRVLSENGTLVSDPEYTACTYTYDEYLRPVRMAYTESEAPSVVMESYAYEYDKNSRIVKETLYNHYPEANGDKQNEERTYRYDTDGKLLVMEVNDLLNTADSHTMTYTYDRAGNRLSQTKETAATAETTTYEYNSLNQLLSSTVTDTDGTVSSQKAYAYDADGNQTKETDSICKTEVNKSYDAAGRLKSYMKKEKGTTTVTQTNQYNGAGARIRKTEGKEVTNYFYSQGEVLYTEDGTGAGTSLNLSGVSGNIIATAREEAGEEGYYYYHKDASGSTTNLRNAAGESIVSYQYTDFGETTIHGDEDFYNEICYNSGIYDKSTGLYYLNARYYDPADGRFISRDSYRGNLSNPSTLHLYAYCANNPVTYSDPSGHVAISRIIGGIVGGGVGAYVGSKIAKKTKATGLKKAAIIAGCTIAGAVVGAIAGPKVAKVAKKVAKAVKKKVTSAAKKLKTTKKTKKATKPKASSTKKVSKTKKISTNNSTTHSTVSNGSGQNTIHQKIIKNNSKVSSSGADNIADGARLKEYYRQAEKYGTDSIKELQNGRFRFYEKLKLAKKTGEMKGARHVREWDPYTGFKRDWYETLDYLGNIRQVRPDPSITGGIKKHYMFDINGNYIKCWLPGQ